MALGKVIYGKCRRNIHPFRDKYLTSPASAWHRRCLLWRCILLVESDISFLTADASLLKLSIEEHLGWLVSYEMRPFTRNQFRDFMVAQSKPWHKMLDLVAQLKVRHGMRIVLISNDSREVNSYRTRTVKLDQLLDTFISSCFVQERKPDAEVFGLGHDLTQTAPAQADFIDNTLMFIHGRAPGNAKHSSSGLRVRLH